MSKKFDFSHRFTQIFTDDSIAVIPAQAGIQNKTASWIPAFAGMTFLCLSVFICG